MMSCARYPDIVKGEDTDWKCPQCDVYGPSSGDQNCVARV